MAFAFQPLELPGLVLVEGPTFPDARGLFRETYRRSAFAAHGITAEFAQDNFSRSARGVLRGLHYQLAAAAQAKLVVVLRGEIFDVAVDIRRGSPSYGRAVTMRLSADRPRMLFIPAGFAHGFCVLSAEADVLYKASGEYAPALQRGIIWNDPDLAIPWPVPQPVLSARDATLPRLPDAENDFHYQPPPAAAAGRSR
jgi:dTDP-4-dehydrorhamnose 3,5-epimerase